LGKANFFVFLLDKASSNFKPINHLKDRVFEVEKRSTGLGIYNVICPIFTIKDKTLFILAQFQINIPGTKV
jgi:hypothetical protein